MELSSFTQAKVLGATVGTELPTTPSTGEALRLCLELCPCFLPTLVPGHRAPGRLASTCWSNQAP